MIAKTENCTVVQNLEIAHHIYDLTVRAQEITGDIWPGQFIHVDCGGRTLLKRPISVCDVKGSELRLIYEVKGEGTQNLSRIRTGEQINLLGPLGNGFFLKPESAKPVLVGGGIGVFPLLYLAKQLKQQPISVMGFRNRSLVTLETEMKEVSEKLFITTDDGTYGRKGFVSDILLELFEKNQADMVYACGPKPMLKVLQKLCSQRDIPLQVSMEERMGCGIGACLTCPCKVKENNEVNYKSVCKCGPVFWGSEVVFDD